MTLNADNELDTKKAAAVLRRPALYQAVNFFLINTLFVFLPYSLGDVLYNFFRISIIFYSGGLILRKGLGTMWHAALAGSFMYFIDHVALKGGIFLLNYLWKPDGPGLAAFSGVVTSFVLFTPLAMAIGALGAWWARFREERTAGSPESSGGPR